MKPLFISCVLPFVFALACLGQGKVKGSDNPTIAGYVELDGKPLVNGQVILGTVTTHMQPYGPDAVVPIITPKAVGVYVETPGGAYEAPDWDTSKKTDKSGHFRVAIPARVAGAKLEISIFAVPMSGKTDKATIERFQNGACLMAVIQPGVRDVRYSLDSGHTAKSQGGCLKESK